MEYYNIVRIAYYTAAIIGAIVATIYYPKYKETPLRLILTILWLGVIADVSGYLYISYVAYYNHWIYNIYNFLYYILFYKTIYDFLKSPRRKKFVFILSCIAMSVVLIRTFFVPVSTQVLIHAYNFATLIFIVNTGILAVEVLKSNEIFILKNSLPVFIFAGYIFFEIAFTPLSIMFDMNLHVFSEDFYYSLRKVQGLILVLMHITFTFAFIWTQPKTIAH